LVCTQTERSEPAQEATRRTAGHARVALGDVFVLVVDLVGLGVSVECASVGGGTEVVDRKTCQEPFDGAKVRGAVDPAPICAAAGRGCRSGQAATGRPGTMPRR